MRSYTHLLNAFKRPIYKCIMSSHVSDEMFSVLGTQQQLSKFVTTINGDGNTFMGDGITANIGVPPPRNGNYVLNESGTLRQRVTFNHLPKKPLDYIHCKTFFFNLNKPTKFKTLVNL